MFVKDGKIENATSIESDESVAEKEIEDADVEDIEAERDIFLPISSQLMLVSLTPMMPRQRVRRPANLPTDSTVHSWSQKLWNLRLPRNFAVDEISGDLWNFRLIRGKQWRISRGFGSPSLCGYKSYLDARGHKYYANRE